jgi:hypothetical protein
VYRVRHMGCVAFISLDIYSVMPEEILYFSELRKSPTLKNPGFERPFRAAGYGAGYTSDLVLRFHVRFAVNRRCDLVHAIWCRTRNCYHLHVACDMVLRFAVRFGARFLVEKGCVLFSFDQMTRKKRQSRNERSTIGEKMPFISIL